MGGGGGNSKQFPQGCWCHFLGLKFHNLFFGLLKMGVIFYGVEKISSIFWLTANLHYFGGVAEKRNHREIDFHSLFCVFFETKLIKFILKRHYSS